MKPFILLVAVVSFAVLAGAQTAVAPTVVKANSVEKNGSNTLQFRGSVRIVIANYVITADEADGQLRGTKAGEVPTDFDLRGNVHLTTSSVR